MEVLRLFHQVKKNLIPILLLAGLTAAYGAFVAGSEAELPERVAVHFGPDGHANGWAARHQAVKSFENFMIFPAIFLLLALVMEVAPVSTFHLPYGEYWLAPQRRAQTVATISRHVIWMGCLLQGFLAGIYWLTIDANRQKSPHLPFLFLPLLLGFLLAMAVCLISLLRPFYQPPAGAIKNRSDGPWKD